MLPNNMLRSQNIFGRNFQNMQSCVMAMVKENGMHLSAKLRRLDLGLQEEGDNRFHQSQMSTRYGKHLTAIT